MDGTAPPRRGGIWIEHAWGRVYGGDVCLLVGPEEPQSGYFVRGWGAHGLPIPEALLRYLHATGVTQACAYDPDTKILRRAEVAALDAGARGISRESLPTVTPPERVWGSVGGVEESKEWYGRVYTHPRHGPLLFVPRSAPDISIDTEGKVLAP